jgi:hypothetical protein
MTIDASADQPRRLADAIRSRGHWWIVMHPLPHRGDRIPYRDLDRTLDGARIQLRGWDFPHFDRAGNLRRRSSSILQETDWRYYREMWEFSQTGQFTYLIGIHEDWIERSPGWGPPPDIAERGRLLGVGDTIARMTEIFVFGSRLIASAAGDDAMHLKIEISQLQGRSLWVDSPRRIQFDAVFASDAETFIHEDDHSREQLETNALALAVDQSLEVFARFGWNPPRHMIEEQQAQLRNVRI